MAHNEIKLNDFNKIDYNTFDIYFILKNKRYTLTALNNLYKFNQEYLKAIHELEKNNQTFNYEPHHSKIAILSYKASEKLIIKDEEELNKFLSLIKISSRLLKKSLEKNDLETLETSLSTLEYNLNLLNFL